MTLGAVLQNGEEKPRADHTTGHTQQRPHRYGSDTSVPLKEGDFYSSKKSALLRSISIVAKNVMKLENWKKIQITNLSRNLRKEYDLISGVRRIFGRKNLRKFVDLTVFCKKKPFLSHSKMLTKIAFFFSARYPSK